MKELYQLIPEERVFTRLIERISYASDAGFYQLVPEAVVKPLNEEEVIRQFHYSQEHRKPMVFRAGGTSLSGQSITDGILVDINEHWRKIVIEDYRSIKMFMMQLSGVPLVRSVKNRLPIVPILLKFLILQTEHGKQMRPLI